MRAWIRVSKLLSALLMHLPRNHGFEALCQLASLTSLGLRFPLSSLNTEEGLGRARDARCSCSLGKGDMEIPTC